MEVEHAPRMSQIVATAQRLQAVRAASRRFLAMWLLDRMVQDNAEHDFPEGWADPLNHDWSLLYRGSILDD